MEVTIFKTDGGLNYTRSNMYIEGSVVVEMTNWEIRELENATRAEIDLILYNKLTRGND